MKNTDDDSPMFEFGDQDYDSAIGWDPGPVALGHTARLIEEDKKRNPRAYAERPEMLLSLPMSGWLDAGVSAEPMEQLFGPFWQRGELAILYAMAGVGKSALATQIAESLARGLRIAPFDTGGTNAEPQNVLYLDFELNTQQLSARYSVAHAETGERIMQYEFSERLIRSELMWNGHVINGYDGFSDMFFTAVSDAVEAYEATVLVIDNITFLDEAATSNISTALTIMRALNRLKRQYNLSILVLAHTRKRRPRQPLSGRDLQGSINLANFADSVFAIGTSRRSRDWRYLKQIKVRSDRMEYDDRQVAVFSFRKFDKAARLGIVQNSKRSPVENFLGYDFVKADAEDNHLEICPTIQRKRQRKENRKQKQDDIKRLAAEGKSVRQIAEALGISKSTSSRLRQGINLS